MKKIIPFLILILLFAFPVSAEEIEVGTLLESEVTADTPLIMISDFSCPQINAGSTGTLSVIVVNNGKADAENLKISYTGEEAVSSGASSIFVGTLEAGKTYEWKISLIARKESGGASLANIVFEYDHNGERVQTADNVTINIKEAPTQAEPEIDSSMPRLIVTDISIPDGYLVPNESKTVKITIKNIAKTKSALNVLMTFVDASGEIKPDEENYTIANSIYAGKEFVWELPLTAANNASSSEHSCSLSFEFETYDGGGGSAAAEVAIPVRQPLKLDFSGASLPAKCTQNESVTANVTFMNVGKATLSNCRVSFESDAFEIGGSTLVGEVAPGESKTGSINFRAVKLGECTGTFILTYENEYGETFTEKVDVTSVIEEQVDYMENNPEEDKEAENKIKAMRWIFLAVGVVVGAGIGVGITYFIMDQKRRKIEEENL
jgi:hypothetical protein